MAETTSLASPPDQAWRETVQAALLAWWDGGHRDLPWRRTTDAYAILVSEIMLQQTQVDRVVPKYRAFLERFPSLAVLAAAPLADVIRQWSGLGYNRRAVNLHRLAQTVVNELGGSFPRNAAALRDLPGIGGYTSRAVASIAWHEPVAAVDTNVRRVLGRLADGIERQRSERETQALADALLPVGRPGDWNQTLMELGALVCRTVPRCGECPVRPHCAAAPAFAAVRERGVPYRTAPRKREAPFEHSARFYRGRIVEMLRASPETEPLRVAEIGRRLRLDYTDADQPWLDGLLAGLARDGLITLDGGAARLPQSASGG